LASVSVDDVRDVVNVSSAEVPDAKVLKMIKRAEVTATAQTRRRGSSSFSQVNLFSQAFFGLCEIL